MSQQGIKSEEVNAKPTKWRVIPNPSDPAIPRLDNWFVIMDTDPGEHIQICSCETEGQADQVCAALNNTAGVDIEKLARKWHDEAAFLRGPDKESAICCDKSMATVYSACAGELLAEQLRTQNAVPMSGVVYSAPPADREELEKVAAWFENLMNLTIDVESIGWLKFKEHWPRYAAIAALALRQKAMGQTQNGDKS